MFSIIVYCVRSEFLNSLYLSRDVTRDSIVNNVILHWRERVSGHSLPIFPYFLLFLTGIRHGYRVLTILFDNNGSWLFIPKPVS